MDVVVNIVALRSDRIRYTVKSKRTREFGGIDCLYTCIFYVIQVNLSKMRVR